MINSLATFVPICLLLKTQMELEQALCYSLVSTEQSKKAMPLCLSFKHIWGASCPTFNDSEVVTLCNLRNSFDQQTYEVIILEGKKKPNNTFWDLGEQSSL